MMRYLKTVIVLAIAFASAQVLFALLIAPEFFPEMTPKEHFLSVWHGIWASAITAGAIAFSEGKKVGS